MRGRFFEVACARVHGPVFTNLQSLKTTATAYPLVRHCPALEELSMEFGYNNRPKRYQMLKDAEDACALLQPPPKLRSLAVYGRGQTEDLLQGQFVQFRVVMMFAF